MPPKPHRCGAASGCGGCVVHSGLPQAELQLDGEASATATLRFEVDLVAPLAHCFLVSCRSSVPLRRGVQALAFALAAAPLLLDVSQRSAPSAAADTDVPTAKGKARAGSAAKASGPKSAADAGGFAPLCTLPLSLAPLMAGAPHIRWTAAAGGASAPEHALLRDVELLVRVVPPEGARSGNDGLLGAALTDALQPALLTLEAATGLPEAAQAA